MKQRYKECEPQIYQLISDNETLRTLGRDESSSQKHRSYQIFSENQQQSLNRMRRWQKIIIFVIVLMILAQVMANIMINAGRHSSQQKREVSNHQLPENKKIASKIQQVVNPPTVEQQNTDEKDTGLSQELSYFHNPRKQHTNHVEEAWTVPLLGRKAKDSHFNFTPVSKEDIYFYEEKILPYFRPYNDTDCFIKRYGDKWDGGYLLCDNFANKSEALLNFDTEGNDSFGCSFTTQYKIPNYQYECSSSAPTCKTNENRNHFYSICLGDRSEKTEIHEFANLKDTIDKLELKGKHITVKIDVEGAEWAALRSLPVQYLDYIDQLILEFHTPYRSVLYESFWGNIDTLKAIDEKFISVNFHMNDCFSQQHRAEHAMPGFAIEVSFVNRKLVNIKSPSRSWKLHPDSTPSPNCQLHD